MVRARSFFLVIFSDCARVNKCEKKIENFISQELVTWSRDQTLRIWNVDETIQKMCEPETPGEEEGWLVNCWKLCPNGICKFFFARILRKSFLFLLSILESVSTDIIFEGIPIKSSKASMPMQSPNIQTNNQHSPIVSTLQTEILMKPMPKFSLQHEFSLLNTNIPHIDVEVLDAVKRHAMIRVSANGHVIMLQVVFPENYPNVEYPPDFIYCQGTSIDDNLAESLNEVLKMNAQNRLRKGKTCLEQCLRALVTNLKKVKRDLIRIYGIYCRYLMLSIRRRLRALVINPICAFNRRVSRVRWAVHCTMRAFHFRKHAVLASAKWAFWWHSFNL